MSIKRYPQQISITNTTNSTSITTGSLVLNGGLGTANDITIGGSTKFFGSNSNFVALRAPTSPLGISFTLPESLPTLANSFLVCDTSGNFNFSSTITNAFTSSSISSSFVDITGLSYTSGAFNILVTVSITTSPTSGNMTQVFQLVGSLSNNSSTLWTLSSIAVSGDNTQFYFNITSSGQLQYRGIGTYTGLITDGLVITWNTPQTSVGTANLVSGTNTTGAPSLGNFLTVTGSSFTDNTTAASGTLTNWNSVYIGTPTLNASNALVTTTNASSLFIQGPPITGTNETITNKYSLNVASGNTLLGGNLSVSGTVLNNSGRGILYQSGSVVNYAGSSNANASFNTSGTDTVDLATISYAAKNTTNSLLITANIVCVRNGGSSNQYITADIRVNTTNIQVINNALCNAKGSFERDAGSSQILYTPGNTDLHDYSIRINLAFTANTSFIIFVYTLSILELTN
jgi:hypothetical protein